MVQIGMDEFILTLAQLAPPGLVNPTREEIEALPKTISPMVVARVAVTPGALKRLMELLQRQLTVYESGNVIGLSEVPDTPDSRQES
jgi:hypothetical protein